MADSLPALNKFYLDNKDKWDKFAVFAIHDGAAKNLADMDKKLGKARELYWGGQDLQIPMLIDGSGKNTPIWELYVAPIHVLIDPEGRLVRGAHLKTLEAKIKG